jgi:hypothetical protein
MGENVKTKTILTQETSGGYIHAYTEEEKEGIVDHINLLLRNDPSVSYLVPVNTKDLSILEAVKDGVLIWYVLFLIFSDTMNNRSLFPTNPDPTILSNIFLVKQSTPFNLTASRRLRSRKIFLYTNK